MKTVIVLFETAKTDGYKKYEFVPFLINPETEKWEDLSFIIEEDRKRRLMSSSENKEVKIVNFQIV